MKTIKKSIILTFLSIFLILLGVVTLYTIPKRSNVHANALVEDSFSEGNVSQEEILLQSEQKRSQGTEMRSGGPRSNNAGIISGEDPLTLSADDLTNVKYIPNANYFLINPYHHENYNDTTLNKIGVCTTVALQMLMGYHNYYSDRRIIPSTFLDADYGSLSWHPAFERSIESEQGCKKIGTLDTFFDELFYASDYPDLGQAISTVTSTGVEFMQNHTPQAVRNNISLTWGIFSKTSAQSDIDAGRPIVLVMHPFNDEHSFHCVPAYGYAKLDGTDGFLVHYGWGSYRTQVWVPASWFAFNIRMTVNTHTHNFIEGPTRGDTHKDLTCNICNMNTTDCLYNLSGGTITSVRHPLSGIIYTPDTINMYDAATASFSSHTITAIGNNAFANQSQIEDLYISDTVTTIGNRAFYDCTMISPIHLYSNVVKIGIEAFYPGTELYIHEGNSSNVDLIIPAGTQAEYESNGWTDFNFVELSATGPLSVVSGQLRGEIEIPPVFNNRTVTEIAPNAFANQTELTGITLPPTVTWIGSSAFANCTKLTTVNSTSTWSLNNIAGGVRSYNNFYYSEESMNVILEPNTTYTLSYYYSNLSSTTDKTNVFTSLGVGNTTFAQDLPIHVNYPNEASGSRVITFTPTAAQLATYNKLWIRFIRTSTPQTVSADITDIRVYKGITNVHSSSFTNCPKLATQGLAYTLQADNTYSVSDGTSSTRLLFIPSSKDGKTVTAIEGNGFNTNKYRWVFMQEGLETIGYSAFNNQYFLEEIDISDSVTDIGNGAFSGCSSILILAIPSAVTAIGANAFQNCTRLTAIGLDDDSVLTSIGNSAFQGCTGLATFTIPSSVTTIGANAFSGCETLYRVHITEGSTLSTIQNGAFSGCEILTDFDTPNCLSNIGYDAFNGCGELKSIVLPSSVTTVGGSAFYGCSKLTIYTARSSAASGWASNWNNSSRPVVFSCSVTSTPLYVTSFVKSSSSPYVGGNTTVGDPYRSGYNFGGWYTTSDFSGTQYTNMTTAPNGTLYAKWTEKSCVAEGTLITLADGSQVAVEDLTGNEYLLVWNMMTGEFDSAPILFIDSDPYTAYEITHLYFSDGTEVKVIDEHGFFDITLNKYVFLNSSAATYIGHWFNKQTEDADGDMIWTSVQLVDVDVYTENTTAWSPVTYGHLCLYVNGMLSMPGATGGFINIFDVDPTTMEYDEEAYEDDIETYGLYTYAEFAELIPIPEVIFNAFNGQYLKVSIGKGLIDLNGIAALVARYSAFFSVI